MKKRITAGALILFVLCLCAALTGCGKDKGTQNEAPWIEDIAASEASVPETAVPGAAGDSAGTTAQKPTAAPETEKLTEAAPATQHTLSYAEVKQAVENGDTSLVTPEFKKTMDDYEAFYDDYIAFMQKYQSGGDTLSMLGDYTKMTEKLAEWTEKIAALDETELSDADSIYLVIVNLRIQEKLALLGDA